MAFSTLNDVIYLDPINLLIDEGDNDDIKLASSNLLVTCTADGDALTGMIPPVNQSGAQSWVANVSETNTLLIKFNDSGSTEGYRFIDVQGATTLTLEPGQCQQFSFISGTGWVPVRPGTFA